MIDYVIGKYQFGIVFHVNGSVFPRALVYALPTSLVAMVLKFLMMNYFDDESHDMFIDALGCQTAYSGLIFILGFLAVFRTSEAYRRFWEGNTMVHNMRTEWFDACSSIVAFTFNAKDQQAAEEVRQIVVRLFSLLHCCALQEIADMAEEEFELLDIRGLDVDSLKYMQTIRTAGLSSVDVVYQWIQNLITRHVDTGLLQAPAPIISRSYQELANGMLYMSSAKKITETPFPFPYAQMVALMLLANLILTPFVMCAWTNHWLWCGASTFISVGSLWCINLIASEIEQPFGDDCNDLPTREYQVEFNNLLMLVLDPRTNRVPHLSGKAVKCLHELNDRSSTFDSFNQAFDSCDTEDTAEAPSMKLLPRSTSHTSFRLHQKSFSPTSEMAVFTSVSEKRQMVWTPQSSAELKPNEVSSEEANHHASSLGNPRTNTIDGQAGSMKAPLHPTLKPPEEISRLELQGAVTQLPMISGAECCVDVGEGQTPVNANATLIDLDVGGRQTPVNANASLNDLVDEQSWREMQSHNERTWCTHVI